MGLAEPRKRIKLSHDPNNTAWTSQPSFGSALMQKSGWTPGTALGASSIPIPVAQSSAAQVKIVVKDNMLGLGANLKSRDIEAQRTGLDAFQGLLGRLNAKDETEKQKVEEKIENRKLEMWARGRWGGMVFVPGGLLVQEDPRKLQSEETTKQPQVEHAQENTPANSDEDVAMTNSEKTKEKSTSISKHSRNPDETPEERALRKSEKQARKQEKAARKEAKLLKKLQKNSVINATGTGTNTDSPSSSSLSPSPFTTQPNTGTSTPVSIPATGLTASFVQVTNSPGTSGTSTPTSQSKSQTRLKNGRHILRGRNIQAKKLAFSDARGLDQIFMRKVDQRQEV